MVGVCLTNGRLQITSPSHRPVGAELIEWIQGEARTAKDKLDGHRETQPEEHGHHLGESRRSTCVEFIEVTKFCLVSVCVTFVRL